ncbi:MAG: hypothetical protein AMK75_06260 [Planctomycetes bacterium SM23_65]|nr:MAG: hypothetical protein AMK75_06260 [Planctomycetes bacterium SM23_65]
MWPWVVVLLLLTAGAFAPSVTTGTFVNGPDSVLRLSLVSTWRNVPAIFTQEFMIFTEGQYRPLSYALLALVRTVVSAHNTLFWHLWLVGFHALNALFVFALARLFARKTSAALAAAALFAVHPMASVFANAMNQFHYVLAGSFYLGTLWCYVKFLRSRRRWLYLLGLPLFACGLLTSKMLLTLPVFLLLYELLYERGGLRSAVVRMVPFVALCLVLAPCWLVFEPHPLFYDYPDFPSGSGWFSLYTFVGRTGLHLQGVASGFGFERPLQELTERIMTPFHPRFVLWGMAVAGVMVVCVVLLLRKHWGGVGILLAMVSVIPYVSTVFHRTREFISWNYLYLVVAGFALVLGACMDSVLHMRRRALRVGVVVAVVVLVATYGALLVTANVHARSPESYWRHVLELNPESEIASVELGRTCLEQGRCETALRYLFAPRVKSICRSSFLMSHYYCQDNELLAAAVHFHMATDETITALDETNRLQMLGAEIVYAAGALDYAEQALTQLLMTNPYDTPAMRMLAEVLSRKGYVSAGLKYLEEARRLDPHDLETARCLERLRRRMYPAESVAHERITPPGPDWLRYLMTQRISPGISDAMIRLSYRLKADPVIQVEGGKCLLSIGEPERAREKFNMAIRFMPSHPYVRACKLSADAEVGALERVGTERETSAARDATMWNDMGYLLFQQGKLEEAVSCFRAALKAHPDSAKAHNNLGLVLSVMEEHKEAVVHYRKAIALSPTDPEPYRSLASALMAQDDFAACIETLSAGLKAVPEDPELKLRLAWVLVIAPEERLRDGARAVVLAEAALRTATVRDARTLNILAAAYAENGQFDKAVGTAREALELARSRGDEDLVTTSERRLRLYEQRRPYRPKSPRTLP